MAPDSLSLKGKVAIVTGSGRENGLGAGIAIALGRNGAWVTLNYISDATASRAAVVAKKIEEVGGKVTIVRADVTKQEGVKKLVDETLKAFQVDKIDILINNAAAGDAGPFMEADQKLLDLTFSSIVYAPIFMAQAVVPHMPRGGRIINIGSLTSKVGSPDMPIYTSAKAALDTFTYSSSMELGRGYGITINSILPGPVETDPVSGPVADIMRRTVLPLTRAEERFGTQDDIADAVLLIVSEKSRWITGQTILVCGGVAGNC